MQDKNTEMHYHKQCPNCGGIMQGDGYKAPVRCENAEVPLDAEADSGPYYCEDPLETFL